MDRYKQSYNSDGMGGNGIGSASLLVGNGLKLLMKAGRLKFAARQDLESVTIEIEAPFRKSISFRQLRLLTTHSPCPLLLLLPTSWRGHG